MYVQVFYCVFYLSVLWSCAKFYKLFSLSVHNKFIATALSLSMIVLNSRDWSEIVWLPKILHFKNQPCNRLIGYNDAVSWLNEAKTQIFQPTANFEIFEIYLYFVSLPACRKTQLC